MESVPSFKRRVTICLRLHGVRSVILLCFSTKHHTSAMYHATSRWDLWESKSTGRRNGRLKFLESWQLQHVTSSHGPRLHCGPATHADNVLSSMKPPWKSILRAFDPEAHSGKSRPEYVQLVRFPNGSDIKVTGL